MLSQLKDLIPHAELWPRFVRNTSESFEARTALVRIEKSPSLFFKDMEGSVMPIAVAHGEGRVLHGNVEALNNGRATIIMPHPERVFRGVQNSWQPKEWQQDGAWMRMFRNARVFVG